MGAPVAVIMGQRNALKGAGVIPAGVYESPQAMLPAQAKSTRAYFTRAGIPASGAQIDQYVSFDGGQTWEYAGGLGLVGGPVTLRTGAIATENSLVMGIPAERGRPRLYKTTITTTDPHDIGIDLKPDQASVPVIANQIIAGMG